VGGGVGERLGFAVVGLEVVGTPGRGLGVGKGVGLDVVGIAVGLRVVGMAVGFRV